MKKMKEKKGFSNMGNLLLAVAIIMTTVFVFGGIADSKGITLLQKAQSNISSIIFKKPIPNGTLLVEWKQSVRGMMYSNKEFTKLDVENWLKETIIVKDSSDNIFTDFTVSKLEKNLEKGLMQVEISVNTSKTNLLIPIRDIKEVIK